ncbi:hypothetical protein IVB13_11930 [Bradyrhizobium sp. 17]|nr:hypothetical protein [Bradyrhizobium sp. 17]
MLTALYTYDTGAQGLRPRCLASLSLSRRPDRCCLPQTCVWQDYDMFPNFTVLKDSLALWFKAARGPLFAVT